MKLVVFLYLMALPLFAEDPWGKDADLVQSRCRADESVSCCSTPLVGSFAETAIAFHQNVISPADGPRSHFYPSSSQYTLDAMRRYGFFSGFVLGCDRLMRENSDPWIYDTLPSGLKYNPVP